MKMLWSEQVRTAAGGLLVAATPQGVCRICFPAEKEERRLQWFQRHFGGPPSGPGGEWVPVAVRQLKEFFQGRRTSFQLALDLRGTPFQLRVWKALEQIPFGSAWTYGQVARSIGNPRAAQAVGAAVGQNPVPIVVPCHRVVGHDGSLVGFGGGLPTKEWLLTLEGWDRRIAGVPGNGSSRSAPAGRPSPSGRKLS